MNAMPAKPLPPKPFILVLMPFAKKLDDVYKVGIYRGFAVGQFWQIGRLSTYEHVIVRVKDEEK
jgi:hypothetical protein